MVAVNRSWAAVRASSSSHVRPREIGVAGTTMWNVEGSFVTRSLMASARSGLSSVWLPTTR